MERRTLVSLTLGSLAELTEVLSGLGDISLVEVEDDARRLSCEIKACQQEPRQPEMEGTMEIGMEEDQNVRDPVARAGWRGSPVWILNWKPK